MVRTTNQFGDVGIELLRHDGAARPIGLGEREEVKFAHAKQDDIRGNAVERMGSLQTSMQHTALQFATL